MSKSVLVVDTPDCCGRCRLLYWGYPFECSYTHNVIHVDSLCSHREKCCPLRPLPERMTADLYYGKTDYICDWEERSCGYNECLDDILRETDN